MKQFGLKELADQAATAVDDVPLTAIQARLELGAVLRYRGPDSTPLMTVQGEIEVDIDEQQLRTRSSWTVGCVRGATRSLEMQYRRPGRADRAPTRRPARSRAESTELRGAGKLTDSARRFAAARRDQAPGHEDSPPILELGRQADLVQRISAQVRAGTIGGDRHHAEREPVGQRGRVAGAPPHRAGRVADLPSRAPGDQSGVRVPRSAISARSASSNRRLRSCARRQGPSFRSNENRSEARRRSRCSGRTVGCSRWSSTLRPGSRSFPSALATWSRARI